jgi:group I intron endonuclease
VGEHGGDSDWPDGNVRKDYVVTTGKINYGSLLQGAIFMYIYVITNSATGKIYIGQHKGNNLKKYLQTKLSDAAKFRGGKSRLYNSMRKHPKEVWSIEPLISDIQTKPELDRWERLLIALFDTRNPEVGYNICKGGEGFTGTHSEESKKRMSARAIEAWDRDPQRKLDMSALKSGVPRTLDVRTRISKSNTGKEHTLETRAKLREARFQQPDPRLGTTHSEATKKRISEAKMGTPSAFKGRHHTDEAKEKNRQARIHNLQGQTFGNLLTLSLTGTRATHAIWQVQCVVCGAEGVVVRSGRVQSGNSRFAKAHSHSSEKLTITSLSEGRRHEDFRATW